MIGTFMASCHSNVVRYRQVTCHSTSQRSLVAAAPPDLMEVPS